MKRKKMQTKPKEMPMTETRQKVWDAITTIRQRSEKDRETLWPPTITEIASEADVDPSLVHRHLEILQAYGFIQRRAGSPRSLQILRTDVPAEARA
jgi:DNA-binding MarR family transcriptional regulator